MRVTEVDQILIYCSCIMPDVGGMIECSNCSMWYHVPSCSFPTQAVLKDTHSLWLCDKCSLLFLPYSSNIEPYTFTLVLWLMFLVDTPLVFTLVVGECNDFIEAPNISSNSWNTLPVPWVSKYIEISGPGVQIQYCFEIQDQGVHF